MTIRSFSCVAGLIVMAAISLRWLLAGSLHPTEVVIFAAAMMPVALCLFTPPVTRADARTG